MVWIAQQASLFEEALEVDKIREMEEPALTESLVALWGRKLGSDKSRKGRSAEWVLAALSDFLAKFKPVMS